MPLLLVAFVAGGAAGLYVSGGLKEGASTIKWVAIAGAVAFVAHKVAK